MRPTINVSEMKATSTVTMSNRRAVLGEHRDIEMTGVHPLEDHDPRVLTEPPGQLRVSDVERDHPPGPVL